MRIEMLKKRAFTFIELLISITIIGIIAGGAALAPGISGDAVVVNQSTNEIKNAIGELQDYAIGQDRDRIKHYILIIRTSGSSSVPYCNQDISNVNQLSKNQYMICSTTSSNAEVDLNTGYKKVKGANISSSVSLSLTNLSSPIVINTRTFDGQLGFDRKYYDTGGTILNGEIDFSKGDIHKIIEIDPIANTIGVKG